MTAKLTPSLILLRSAFVSLFGIPFDKIGWIGDQAHQQRKSKHNPDSRGLVHAIDVPKFDGLHECVLWLARRCRDGVEKRLTAIIWHGNIWLPENGWEPVDYDGGPSGDRHYEHAHFSGSDTPSLEKSQASWHLEDSPMDLTPEAVNKVADAVVTKMRTDPRGAISVVDEQQEARAVTQSDAFENLQGEVDGLRNDVRTLLDIVGAEKPAPGNTKTKP